MIKDFVINMINPEKKLKTKKKHMLNMEGTPVIKKVNSCLCGSLHDLCFYGDFFIIMASSMHILHRVLSKHL